MIFNLLRSSGNGDESVLELCLVVGLEKDGLPLPMAVIRFNVVNQNLIWFFNDESCCHQTFLILLRESHL